MRPLHLLATGLALLAALLAGCATPPPAGPSRPVGARPDASPPSLPPPVTRRGADGPPDQPSPDPASVPDAEPRIEPIRAGGPNKPYEVAGQSYVPLARDEPVVETGLASWYGKKFHGRRTASGEVYNMHAMTAAHKTMPLPSFARVRNPANGREVIVRVNDRGPFVAGRILDLSYAAAMKLGVVGLGQVEVSRLTHDEIRAMGERPAATALAQAAPTPPLPPPPPALPQAKAAPTPPPRPDPDVATIAAPVLLAAATPATALAATPSATPAATPTATPAATPPTPTTVASGAATAAAASVSAGPLTPAPLAGPLAAAPPAGLASASPPAGLLALPANPADAGGGRLRAYTQAAVGYWLQLGAFARSEGALGFHQQLSQELHWLAPLLAVFVDGPLHRLQAGPYASRETAQAAAEQVRAAVRLAPLVIERR